MTTQNPAKTLIPTRPTTSLFAPLQREFNRFFDDLGDGFTALAEPRFAPRMDVAEIAEGLKVSAEVPGMAQDDLKITAEDHVLTISGEKTETKSKPEGARRITERSYGSFSRSIFLPQGADTAKISATLKDGVLEVIVPRRAGSEAQTIAIQSK